MATSHKHQAQGAHSKSHYGRLLIMSALSFLSMYALMYAMVDIPGNVFMNLNQVYMAGLMTAPMVLLELWLMRGMYPDRTINLVIAAVSAIALLAFFFLIRQQTAISDKQFLRSMIPHHAGAVLMCGRAPVHDLEIKKLCQTIISGQQSEIAQMRTLLREMEK